MKILYFRSVWGMDAEPSLAEPSLAAKLAKIKAGSFDGVELEVPLEAEDCRLARRVLNDLGLEVIAQQWRTTGNTVAEHKASFEPQFERALLLEPLFLNSHTGRDHFSFEQNLEIFDHTAELAARHGLDVRHETHRSRALFTTPAAVVFLKARPELKLVADFSHWCAVHESLLEDQSERMEYVIAHSYAIHARVGHAEGPQIPDPRDPLWEPQMEAHLGWWRAIAQMRRVEGVEMLPITPEFGPAPYMTLLPHTHAPIADLWEVNVFMLEWLKENLGQV